MGERRNRFRRKKIPQVIVRGSTFKEEKGTCSGIRPTVGRKAKQNKKTNKESPDLTVENLLGHHPLRLLRGKEPRGRKRISMSESLLAYVTFFLGPEAKSPRKCCVAMRWL